MLHNRAKALRSHGIDDNVSVIPASPDMSVLSAGRRTPPSIPTDMFGPIWPLLDELAEGAGAPVDYVALSYIAVVASLIGGKRKVQPYRESDWHEPTILWVGLVGDPSSNKSPALDRAVDTLRDMQSAYATAHNGILKGWEADCERAKFERAKWQAAVKAASDEGLATPPLPDEAMEPLNPKRHRVLVQDPTPESVADILSGNPQGTLLVRDELSGWLTSFDRYTPGGREFWLEAFGGRPFVIDRKSSPEPVTVPFNGVSVAGGIQPEKLADALFGRGKPDDGLVARFLWTWPDRPPYRRPRRAADRSVLEAVYSRLDGLDWGVGADGRDVAIVLPLDDDAADLFEAFERHNRDSGDDAGGLFKSFCGKLPGIVLRLAIASELSRWAYQGGPEPTSISVATIEAVTFFVEDYAKPMALRVFGDAALPPAEKNAATLARYIQKYKLRRVNARDLRRTARLPGLKEAEPMREALALLVDANWLAEDGRRQGDSPGRHSSDFTVNPAVHGGDGE